MVGVKLKVPNTEFAAVAVNETAMVKRKENMR